MWGKYVIPILAVLFISVFVAGAVLAEIQDAGYLPNVAYTTVVEPNGGLRPQRIYIKDGQIYAEIGDQLYVMDVLQETLLSFVEGTQTEVLATTEIRELGEVFIDGQRALHYQVISKETGLLQHEGWLAQDLPLPLALKTISYDPQGNVSLQTSIFDIDFDPDFSGLDFSKALSFPLLGDPPAPLSLTPEEFQEMVPWYDLSLKPLPGHELTGIRSGVTWPGSGSLQFTLTYSLAEEEIEVMIFGERAKLAQTHGPSQFKLVRALSREGFLLEPALHSVSSEVTVGFLGGISLSDGNIFLRQVVLHPTLQ